MEYTYYTIDEIITSQIWEVFKTNLGTDDVFYKYVMDEIWRNKGYWFIHVKPEGIDEELEKIKVSELTESVYQWLKQNQILFNKTYDLIYNPTTGSSKRTTKFNDTPQSEGSYSTDRYTSTVTTDEATGTVGSSEQLRQLRDIIGYSIDDFRRRFVIHVD